MLFFVVTVKIQLQGLITTNPKYLALWACKKCTFIKAFVVDSFYDLMDVEDLSDVNSTRFRGEIVEI